MTQRLFQRLLPIEEPYSPVYRRNDAIAGGLTTIDRERWSFDNLIIDPDYRAWFQERAIIRTVHSSTSIEGNRLDETQAGYLIRGQDVDAEEAEKREVINLTKALKFVDEVSGNSEIPIDEPVVREINRRILLDESEVLTPGQYRLGQSRVRNPMTGGIAYVAPNAGDVPVLMRQFGLWLRQDHEPFDAPLIAAVAHLRLVEIHPFWDGNGRTARALSTLILQRLGYSFNRLLSPERQFAWGLQDYFRSIGAVVGPEHSEGRDLTTWIEYFLYTLDMEIRSISELMVDFRRFIEITRESLRPLGLSRRQVDVLAYAYIHGSVRPRDYLAIFDVSRETARRDLSKLTQIGLLRPIGASRSRRYELVL